MKEHRKLARPQVNQHARLKLEQAAGLKELLCEVKDINSRGAKISLNTKLPEDRAFRISIELCQGCSIDAEAWVARSKVIDGINHYGLFFSKIEDVDKGKIHKFINSYSHSNFKHKPCLGAVETEKEEGGEDMSDHRIFERFKKEFAARFIGLDGKETQAQTFDVSAKGMGLSTTSELQANTSLEIWLDIPNSTDPLYTRGQVVWSRLSEAGMGYRSGIELERADLMGISRLLRA